MYFCSVSKRSCSYFPSLSCSFLMMCLTWWQPVPVDRLKPLRAHDRVSLSHRLTLLVSLQDNPVPPPHLSRLSLWANILQSFPLVCGASRLPHNFCRMETGMRKALGPTSVVMLLAGSSKDVSILWESCRRREETEIIHQAARTSLNAT